MNNEIYEMYKRNSPYINREEKTVKSIIDNEKNIVFEKNSNNELIGCAIVNKNAIILLVVDKKYRNIGIGTNLVMLGTKYLKDIGLKMLV